MTQSNAGDSGNPKEAKLPRRDWILLPALSLITICLLVVSTNLVARWVFASPYGGPEECMVNDPSTGMRGIPNCVCRERIAEGDAVEYRFNNCGYRTNIECGPKVSGAFRIVMIGSSFAMGLRVANEKTFAALLPTELSLRTGRNIELLNEGMPVRHPHIFALHFNQVLAARPDMILWIILPLDVLSATPPPPRAGPRQAPQALSQFERVKRILASLSTRVENSNSVFLLRQFFSESQSQYIKSTLLTDQGRGPEYLKAEPNAEWQGLLRRFDSDAAEIEAQARAAGVPVVAALLPERAQAAMISRGEWPARFDPYKLDNDCAP